MKIGYLKNATVSVKGAKFSWSKDLLKLVAPNIHRRMEMENYIKQAFPDNHETVLETMDTLNRGSFQNIEQTVLQIWLAEYATIDDMRRLYDANPYVFRNLGHPYKLMEKPAAELLPMLAAEAMPDQ